MDSSQQESNSVRFCIEYTMAPTIPFCSKLFASDALSGLLSLLLSPLVKPDLERLVFTKASDQPRAAEPEVLAARFSESHGRTCQTAANVKEALEIAARAASRDDLICVTGSFYLVGETLDYLKELQAQRG